MVRSKRKVKTIRVYTNRRDVLRSLGFKTYISYLKSKLWARIRRKVFAIKGKLCKARCGKPAVLIHHESYSVETMRGDSIKYLTPLCKECHQYIEFDDKGNKVSLARANLRLIALKRVNTIE